jgi:DAK2 domain fusion protein YloV
VQHERLPVESTQPASNSRLANADIVWTASFLRSALEAAVERFRPHVASINALNVFPVPDGDTGTNMLLTLESALRAAESARLEAAGPLLREVTQGALMGARGNSGVILYQFFAGLSEAADEQTILDGAALARGLATGARLAYQAVLNPVEGTMLTVLREMAAAATGAVDSDPRIAAALLAARQAAIETVQRTPDMLPILKHAGVVDAGGQGIAVLVDALAAFATGTEPVIESPALAVPEGHVAEAMEFLDRLDELHGEEAFGYCTNFVLTGEDIPVDDFRRRIQELGASAVIVGNQRMLKVHLHTEHPGLVLETALSFGELDQVRIDNMARQTRELVAEREAARARAPEIPIGIVAVANGEGLVRVFEGLGATVVPGGATMNPSTQDLLAAIERLPQEEVIVLPNDSNIVPTAQQAARLARKEVRVVPTHSIQQGIAALAGFNFAQGLDENVAAMGRAMQGIRSLSVTQATRDATLNGVTVRQGQWIGLLDDHLIAGTDDLVSAVVALLEAAEPSSAELLTLFTGRGLAAARVDQLVELIRARWPHLEIEVIAGGQPHYPLLLALE